MDCEQDHRSRLREFVMNFERHGEWLMHEFTEAETEVLNFLQRQVSIVALTERRADAWRPRAGA
jgi:hypothetical protein